jgi:hypothetical protein
MAEPEPGEMFDLYRAGPADGDETHVGRVSFSPSGLLELLEATPEEQPLLDAVVAGVNAKDALPEKVPPPPGAPRYAVQLRQVSRSDGEFLRVLQDYLARYYGLTMR